MKKNLLFIAFILASISINAQFEVRDGADNLITDGQTIAFAEGNCGFGDPCNWKFKVTNTGDSDMNIKIFCDALNNTDGENFQLCFAEVCLNSVEAGIGYPANAAVIAAGETNYIGNSMWNQNDTGATEMSWSFRFQQLDDSGNAIGTPISMTYAFDPNLSVDDFNKLNVSVYPTIATNVINVNAQTPLEVTFYNLLGKTVKKAQIASGISTIDVSELASQPYLLRFTNKEGQELTKKVVIK